jgi:Ca2+-binding EF-hand superfamily protein
MSEEHALWQAFSALDQNDDGVIDAEDLLKVYTATFDGQAWLDEASTCFCLTWNANMSTDTWG